MVPRRPTRPFRTNTQKRCPFHYRGLECKSRKSRNTWGNRQIWPWSTKWSEERLIKFCQENALVIANTLFRQHKRRLYTWTSPGGQQRNQMDYILCNQRWRSSAQSAKTRTGADCGRSWTPYCQIQTYIEESRENHWPFRYDLNQIPYDYTVEVRNRFKGLDLIVPDELWMEVRDIVQETGIKTISIKRNAKRQNGCPRRPYK